MDRKSSLFERVTGFILLVVVLLLGVFWLITNEQPTETSLEAIELLAEESAEINPTTQASGVETNDTSEAFVLSDSGEPLEVLFDISEIEVRNDPSLSPKLNPITYKGKLPEHELSMYVVQRGDTPIKIAERFGISAETILGGNPTLSEEAGLLQVDDELIILPIDGVLHTVRPGETLVSVAQQYGVETAAIVDYEPNNMEFPYRLYADSQILIPGAVREVFQWDPPSPVTYSNGDAYWASQSEPLIKGTGTFVRPVAGGRITQEYWYGHQAVDIAVVEGTPLYASDTGTVTYASWSPYCYGSLIVINHGNGYETFYAHLSGINVVPGQIVYQGNLIGYSGNTGCSSGPHLHFEVRVFGNRDDPFWYISR